MIPDWMLVGAFRYYLGRSTYAVSDCTQWIIDHKHELDRRLRDLFIKEIIDALEQDRAGMDMDRKRWFNVLEVLYESYD